ncbi:MAG: hypothetical protein MUP04_05370, partial [Anaerolineae bacterium]|nr:hypothetical protein [Anaerolineae bacterium]
RSRRSRRLVRRRRKALWRLGSRRVAELLRRRRSSRGSLERRRGLRRLENIYAEGSPDLDVLLPFLEELKVKERCQERARHFQKRALEELERTGIDNRAQGDLRDLALFLVERRF